MITKNPMQLKAFIKNKAAEKHISAQLVMQNYMLERLLERISLSDVYKRQIYKSRAYAIFSYFHPLFQTVALSAHRFNAIIKPHFTQRFSKSCKIDLQRIFVYKLRCSPKHMKQVAL